MLASRTIRQTGCVRWLKAGRSTRAIRNTGSRATRACCFLIANPSRVTIQGGGHAQSSHHHAEWREKSDPLASQGVALSDDRSVTITLTDWQVARVVREAAVAPGLTALPAGLDDFGELHGAVMPLLDDAAYSRSTLRALLVLGAFPPDGSERELTDVARQLDLSPSTTHRYIGTWMAVGLLEQHPRSRRYRRAPPDAPASNGRGG